MMASTEFEPIVVSTTSDQKEVLNRLAKVLVEKNLAACVQISGPISSCYQWQGAVETSNEWLCLIKTSRHKYAELERVLLDLHNYDEPQVIAVEICEGSESYLKWLEKALNP